MVIYAGQQTPFTEASQAFAEGLHWIQLSSADGIIMMKRVMMQNQTDHRVFPDVRRRRVTPNEILERVDAKQEIEATTELPRAIVAKFSWGMSFVNLPNPIS
jgi:hypothetical protein